MSNDDPIEQIWQSARDIDYLKRRVDRALNSRGRPRTPAGAGSGGIVPHPHTGAGQGGPVDAGFITYTPSDLTKWTASADPGNANAALDQLASRLTTVEGGAAHAAVTLGADAATVLGLTGQEITLNTQAANTVFAGPTSGGAADPAFRALTDADIPVGIARAADVVTFVGGEIATHAAASDPHAGYVREADANWIDLTDGGATTLHSHAGGSGHTIQENGTPLASEPALNFVSGLTATDNAGVATNVNLGPLTIVWDQTGAFNIVQRGGDLHVANSRSIILSLDDSATPTDPRGRWDADTGHMSLGFNASSTDPLTVLNANDYALDPAGVFQSIVAQPTVAISAAGSGVISMTLGPRVTTDDVTPFTQPYVRGLIFSAGADGAVTVNEASNFDSYTISVGGVTGTVDEFAHIRLLNQAPIGTLTTQYGIYAEDLTAGETNWFIYSLGGPSYHQGALQLGGATAGSAGVAAHASAILDLNNISDLALRLPSIATADLPAGTNGLVAYDATTDKVTGYIDGAYDTLTAAGVAEQITGGWAFNHILLQTADNTYTAADSPLIWANTTITLDMANAAYAGVVLQPTILYEQAGGALATWYGFLNDPTIRNVGNVNPGPPRGIIDDTTFDVVTHALTLTEWDSFRSHGRVTASGGGTLNIDEHSMFRAGIRGLPAGSVIGTLYGFRMEDANGNSGDIDMQIGLAIETLVEGTVNHGIWNESNSVQTGYASFGATTVPTNTANGDVTAVQLYVPKIIGSPTDASAGTLTLTTTDHPTKGKILFGTSAYDEANNRLGIKTASPAAALHVAGDDIILTGGKALRENTADAADNSFVSVAGGGATGNTRGAYITVIGNEFGSGLDGAAIIEAGNVANGVVSLRAGNANRFQVTNDSKMGFFGATNVVKQTSGANLTNSVTAGGTDDTIANYTSLTVYATDAAAIRNDIYQLARKLKQINDGLRSYGLFT